MTKEEIESLTTDELLEMLPNHLMLARNSNAPEFDRWRLFTIVNQVAIESSGRATGRQCLLDYLKMKEREKN